MRFPGAVRVRNPHEENAPVAVDIVPVETVRGLLARVRPNARAAESSVGEPGFGAVRVHARDDVERAGLERLRDTLVLSVAVEQPIEEVERRWCR